MIISRLAAFQFTTSQGGRRDVLFPGGRVSIFQFTTSQGGRRSLTGRAWHRGTFQFTTSQGGRLVTFSFPSNLSTLSIHDLTRRSTRFRRDLGAYNSLSIHDLTRRSTKRNALYHPLLTFNSRPHKEVDDHPRQ